MRSAGGATKGQFPNEGSPWPFTRLAQMLIRGLKILALRSHFEIQGLRWAWGLHEPEKFEQASCNLPRDARWLARYGSFGRQHQHRQQRLQHEYRRGDRRQHGDK